MIGSKVWLTAAIVAAGLASAAHAQGNLKIGVINLGRVVESSPQWTAAKKKIDEEFGPRQRELEAMATELPVVTTAVGGIPDVIEHDVTGFLFRPGERSALTRQLVSLFGLQSLGRRVGAAAGGERQRASRQRGRSGSGVRGGARGGVHP